MRYAIQDGVIFREHYITTNRTAELLGCADLTVQHWAKEGRIAAVTGPDIDSSHSYRFDREALMLGSLGSNIEPREPICQMIERLSLDII